MKETFDAVYNDIADMSQSLQDMTTRLQNAKKQTKHLLEQTNTFEEELSKNEMQQKVVAAFIDKFILTPEELIALHGTKHKRDTPISLEIFVALDRVQKIHNDCKVLMQSGHQTLALDVMEQMTLHQVDLICFSYCTFLIV